MRVPGVAYFRDSFSEVKGGGHTSRNFVAYAERHGLPFLCVRAGGRADAFEQEGELRTLELGRSRASVWMEKDLEFDALFWRHGGAGRGGVGGVGAGVRHHRGAGRAGGVCAALARGVVS